MVALHRLCLRAAAPLAASGAVVELDRLIDVQTLAWPILAALAVCCGVALLGLGKVCAE